MMEVLEITFEQFSAETATLKRVSGGETFSGGTFSEYGRSDERNATHRYEIDAAGNEKWYVIKG